MTIVECGCSLDSRIGTGIAVDTMGGIRMDLAVADGDVAITKIQSASATGCDLTVTHGRLGGVSAPDIVATLTGILHQTVTNGGYSFIVLAGLVEINATPVIRQTTQRSKGNNTVRGANGMKLTRIEIVIACANLKPSSAGKLERHSRS